MFARHADGHPVELVLLAGLARELLLERHAASRGGPYAPLPDGAGWGWFGFAGSKNDQPFVWQRAQLSAEEDLALAHLLDLLVPGPDRLEHRGLVAAAIWATFTAFSSLVIVSAFAPLAWSLASWAWASASVFATVAALATSSATAFAASLRNCPIAAVDCAVAFAELIWMLCR